MEAQTKRLIEVCRQRDTPIMTFVNKWTARPRPVELLDEIGAELGMPCVPMTLPVRGKGQNFGGIINLRTQTCACSSRVKTREASQKPKIPLSDIRPRSRRRRFGADFERPQWRTSSCSPACPRRSTARPFSPPNRHRCSSVQPSTTSACRKCSTRWLTLRRRRIRAHRATPTAHSPKLVPDAEGFSGVVFKVQANAMDPQHRDRIAFVRVCSGKYAAGMKLKVVRSGKEMRPWRGHLLSQRREAVDEAYAGDIIGFTIHGGVQLGDTITDGASLQFTGLPFFAPELFQTVELKNPLKSKATATRPCTARRRGAIQVFKPQLGSLMLLGAVGQLQFEVVQHRLSTEYKAEIALKGSQFVGARWVTCDDPAEMKKFMDYNAAKLAYDAANTLAYLLTSNYDLRLRSGTRRSSSIRCGSMRV